MSVEFARRGLATAAAMVAAGTLVWGVQLSREVDRQQRELAGLGERARLYEEVVGLLGSDRLVIRQLQPTAGTIEGRATVYLDPQAGRGLVAIQAMPSLPEQRALQVWFVRADRVHVSGGIVRPGERGAGYAVLSVPEDMAAFESITVSEEPAAGSPWPTSPRLLATDLVGGR